MMRNFLVLAAACVLAGCMATPEASREDDAAAKQFEAAPASAIVYLYRADFPSGRASTALWLDGRLIGELVPAAYFRVAVRPGRNVLTAAGSDMGRLALDTRSNEVYFVAIDVPGDQGTQSSHFRLVTPATGRAQIEYCCHLLETWKPGQNRIPR